MPETPTFPSTGDPAPAPRAPAAFSYLCPPRIPSGAHGQASSYLTTSRLPWIPPTHCTDLRSLPQLIRPPLDRGPMRCHGPPSVDRLKCCRSAGLPMRPCPCTQSLSYRCPLALPPRCPMEEAYNSPAHRWLVNPWHYCSARVREDMDSGGGKKEK
jgi:hypothetical protein